MSAFPKHGSVADLFYMAGTFLSCARTEAGQRNQLAAMAGYYGGVTRRSPGKEVQAALRAVRREVRHDAMMAQWLVLKGLVLLRTGGQLT